MFGSSRFNLFKFRQSGNQGKVRTVQTQKLGALKYFLKDHRPSQYSTDPTLVTKLSTDDNNQIEKQIAR